MDPRNTIVLHMINTYDRQCAQFVRPSPGILGVFLSGCQAAYRTWKLGKRLHLVIYHSPSGITGNQKQDASLYTVLDSDSMASYIILKPDIRKRVLTIRSHLYGPRLINNHAI